MSWWQDVSRVYRQLFHRLRWLVVVLALMLYGVSGFYSVDADQRAVVSRFGRIVEQNVMPGMHYRLPWPVESVETLSAVELRSINIDFAKELDSALTGSELTTGKGDLIELALQVQYSIPSPGKFLSVAMDAETILRNTAKAQAVIYVSQRELDSLLTTGRSDFQQWMQQAIQQELDSFGPGITVTNVMLNRLETPAVIKQAYDEVQMAPAAREKLIQDALGERETKLAQARSEVNNTLKQAQAQAQAQVANTEGEVQRLNTLIVSLERQPGLAKKRLYLETLKQILEKARVSFINRDKP
ncbi:protease modulator HflK [Endozoicomonas gorgoniicola]|uniref:Protease modulator HflK n=1 Tax=Endozoicomonas gorgoniicola TaxID=1234144 RepID=A0ABT3MXS1_9GAMM|nr:protease modulator HflK [Endozoicomonas gorgoniicola]MCW7554175.1 protease modulator HflK [Endozoicomonas gorgoniicola]